MKNLQNKLFYFKSFLFYIVLILITLFFSSILIEEYANSFLISFFASRKPISSDIMEVVVDDYSIQKYKWEKDTYADLLNYFSTYTQAKVIGFDFTPTTFGTEVAESEKKFISQVNKMDNLVFGFAPERVINDEDEELLKDFKKHSLNIDLQTDIRPSYFNGIKSASSALRDATKNYGSVRVDQTSSSGTLIDIPNIVQIKDNYYPSLGFKMYLLANSTNDVVLGPNYLYVPKTNLKLKYIWSGGSFYNFVRYYRQGIDGYTYPMIHASQIIDTYAMLKAGITPKNHPELYDYKNGKLVDPAIFKDKAIFVGANITGPSQDILKTPMLIRHPGVDIHATVYNNLMSGHTLEFIGLGLAFLIFVLLCAATFAIILRMHFIQGLILILGLDICYLICVFFAASNGYLVSYATPVMCQFVTAVFAYSFKFLTESRNKEKIKNAMGKYLSQDIMKNVVKNIDDLKLGGKRAVVTVLFSDIRGFTSMSEKMSAEEVSAILNEYFGEMEPIITKYNGVINKFIGDAIMAIFGEPIQDDNHPQNAVKCAYEMLKRVEYLREKWIFEGKPKFDIGIGINTGEVFIGNIGTETRMEYTVIGDTVNLASRIEGYNKVYKTNLLVSTSTYSYISEIADVIKIKEVQIRGKAKKMDIYEVLRIKK